MSDLLNNSEFILLLCKEIGNGWKTLGRELLVEQATLDSISVEYARLALHELSYQMLLSWKKANPNRTIEDLKTALKNAGRGDLVTRINQISGKSFNVLSLF